MDPAQPVSAPNRPINHQIDWMAVTLIVVSGLGLGVFLFCAFGLFLMGILAVAGKTTSLQVSVTPVFSLAWVSILLAALTLVSVIYAIRGLYGNPKIQVVWGKRWFLVASGLLILVPLVLLAGDAVAKQSRLAWLLLPPLQLLVVALPLWWMVEAARRSLWRTSPQRTWGMLNFSLLITAQVILVVEIVGMGLIVIGGAVALAAQPGLADELQRLALRLANSQMDPEIVTRVFKPILQQSWVLFGILAMGAGVVPMLEELLKPLGLWALLGRKLTPIEGFVLGAVSGAGFALLESLGNLASPLAEGWLGLAAGRIGTGMLHVTCSALVGWGLASAWGEGRYLRLGWAYALAVLLHGVWNVFGLMVGIGPILSPGGFGVNILISLGKAAPYALGGMGVILLAILLVMNFVLQRQVHGTGQQLLSPAHELPAISSPDSTLEPSPVLPEPADKPVEPGDKV